MYGGGYNGMTIIKITTLHGYTIEELIYLKDIAESKYTRLALKVITMRYNGYSNDQIVEATGLNKVTIINHVKNGTLLALKRLKTIGVVTDRQN